MMKVTFWGVRGSIPTPGYETAKYGGNTLCVEIRFEGCERTVIIDAGSGIRRLGIEIQAHRPPKAPVDLFFTHTHLDHILGFAFFSPLFAPESRLTLYGPVVSSEDSLERTIGGQLSYRYFPLRQVELAARIRYVDLTEGVYDLGDGIVVSAAYLNHPLLCMGYRFEHRGKTLCTAFDTEPFRNLFDDDPGRPGYDEALAQEGARAARDAERRLTEFLKGADLLIHDGQYTEKEYAGGRVGWGHSSIEHAVGVAEACGARHLALVHHDPMRTDQEMDMLAVRYGGVRPGTGLEVVFAREGLTLSV